MKIVYVGPLWDGATSKQRLQAFITLGHEVLPVDIQPEKIRQKNQSLSYRIVQRIMGPIDLAKANNQIIQRIISVYSSIDVLWVDKGQTIIPGTLKKIKKYSPKTTIVHYNPDDPFGRLRHGWGNFFAGASLYDIHFVPRPQNIAEYKAIGCKNVFLFKRSFDPQIHHPVDINDEDRQIYGGQVGFIGTYEKERAYDLLYLAENGIPVRIWGLYWHKAPFLKKHPNIKMEYNALWTNDYSRAISSFDINLSFLRKDNRDYHNSRSIEIPACGGFMLAERSVDHLELFEEGKEAEYFDSREELHEKIKYYLANDGKRKAIARSGYLRCIRSGHGTIDRMSQLLEIVANFKCNPKNMGH